MPVSGLEAPYPLTPPSVAAHGKDARQWLPALIANAIRRGGVRLREFTSRSRRGARAPLNFHDAPFLLALWLAGAEVEVQARLDPAQRRIAGTATWTLRHPGGEPLRALRLHLYPRYLGSPRGLDDTTWPRFYPRNFSPGEMRISSIERIAEGGTTALRMREGADPWLAWIDLDRPWEAGTQVVLRIAFETMVPERFGPFGWVGERLTLAGGWLPSFDAPLDQAHIDLDGLEVLALRDASGVGLYSSADRPPLTWSARWGELEIHGLAGDATALDRARQLGIAALNALSLRLKRPLHAKLVEAPLRQRLYRRGPGATLLSDRLYRLADPLLPYHDAAYLAAVIGAALQEQVLAREGPRDARWVLELLAWELTAQHLRASGRGRPELVGQTLGLFDFIPSVDHILRAPRFPFHEVFFHRPYERDELRDDVGAQLDRRSSGRSLRERLRQHLGDAAVERLVAEYLVGPRPLAQVLDGPLGGEAARGAFLDTWLEHPPVGDYALGRPRWAARPDGGYDLDLNIHRHGESVVEPLEILVEDDAGTIHRARRAGPGPLRLELPRPPARIELDPQRRLDESEEDDNRWPRRTKFLLNRLHVDVDLNGGELEYYLGMTLVPRRDYRQRVTIDAFDEQPSDGLRLGYHRGLGAALDRVRQRLVGTVGLSVERLDEDFVRSGSGRLADRGDLLGLNLGLRDGRVVDEQSPLGGLDWALGLSHHPGGLGSDFRFDRLVAEGGWRRAWGPAQVLALRLRGGTVEGRAPTQGLLDAGGEDAVRGIKTGRLLHDKLAVASMEWRHLWLADLDIDLGRLLWLRQIQGALFFDVAGSDDRGAELLDRARALTAVGYGLRWGHDLLGFKNSVLRLDVSRRTDAHGEPLFYLGINQSF